MDCERITESNPKLQAGLAELAKLEEEYAKLEEEFEELGRHAAEIKEPERWASALQDVFFNRRGRTGHFVNDKVLAIVARRLVRVPGLVVYKGNIRHPTLHFGTTRTASNCSCSFTNSVKAGSMTPGCFGSRRRSVGIRADPGAPWPPRLGAG
jgi:hypothetical protein